MNNENAVLVKNVTCHLLHSIFESVCFTINDISTSFRVLRAPESWSKYFIELFSMYFNQLSGAPSTPAPKS